MPSLLPGTSPFRCLQDGTTGADRGERTQGSYAVPATLIVSAHALSSVILSSRQGSVYCTHSTDEVSSEQADKS